MDTRLNIPHLERCKQEFQKIYFEGDVVAEVLVQIFGEYEVAHVHHEVCTFNKSIYKLLLAKWISITNELSKRGINKVITYTKDIEDKKLPKYWSMFGFDEPILLCDNGHCFLYTEMEI